MEPVVVNLGQVQFGLSATANFELRNNTENTLYIFYTEESCSCTTTSYPTDGVAPGQVFHVRVSFQAEQMGHFAKWVDVYTSADPEPLMLELRGVVKESVDELIDNYPFELGELLADCNSIEFEDLRKGETRVQRFMIYNPTSETINPTIMHMPAYLTAEIEPAYITPNHSAEVTLTLNSSLCRNYGFETTSIYLGANPGDKIGWSKLISTSFTLLPAELELTDTQRIYMPKATLSSNEIELPVADGKKRSGTIIIQNTGRSELEIYSMQKQN